MKFFLKDTSSGNSYIFMDINYHQSRIRLSTGYQIKSSNWDDNSQKVKRNEQNYITINNNLTSLQSKVDDFISNLKLQRKKMNNQEFSIAIRNLLDPDYEYSSEVCEGFFDVFKKWIEKRELSGIYSFKRIEQYITVYRSLKLFEKSTGFEITFQKIDKNFYEKFISYLINEKGLVNITINSDLSVLRTFLNDIKEEYGDVLNKQFSSLKLFKDDEPPTVALSDAEYRSIIKLDLKSPALQIARDLFVFQTNLLLRFSDLKQIKSENIDKTKKILTLHQIKTGDKIRVPLSDKSIELLEKWNYLIPNISKQSYNAKIKEICKLAEIKDVVQLVRFSGSRRITETRPKYEIISSHTARRTGITLLILKGIPLSIIMKISGHKKIETLMKYARITSDEAVEIVRGVLD